MKRILRRVWEFEEGCRRDGRGGPLGYLAAFVILAVLLVISHGVTGSWSW